MYFNYTVYIMFESLYQLFVQIVTTVLAWIGIDLKHLFSEDKEDLKDEKEASEDVKDVKEVKESS